VYFIAANVPLWIASRSLGLSLSGIFNLEFLIIGALSVFLRRTLIVCLLLTAIALDLLNCVCKTYLFGYSDLWLSATSLFEFAPSHLWNLAVLTLCVGLVSLVAIAAYQDRPDPKERRYVVWSLTIIAMICVAFDCSRGQIAAFRPDCRIGQLRLVRNSVHPLVESGIQRWSFRHQAHSYAAVPMMGASRKLVELDIPGELPRPDSNRPNVVFVLVESWGKSLSGDLEGALVQPYVGSDLKERYTVSRGAVPFHGATVAGELRELCSSAMGFGVISAPAVQLKNCLPAKLELMGYHTVGVHGFGSGMFERSAWYRKMRFDETWFRDELKGQGLPQCPGPFPGICDAAISGWIGDRLQANSDSPQFIYWVTLNSHLPVPVPNLVNDPPACSRIASIANDPAICSWYQLVFNVHRSVSELAMRSMARPTVFVIVGDHAPPFSAPELRSQFSDAVVPYIILWPKGRTRDESQAARSIAATVHPSDRTRKLPLKKSKTSAHLSISGY